MTGVKLESVQWVKYFGVTIASSTKLSQQCKKALGKANRVMGFINRHISHDIYNSTTVFVMDGSGGYDGVGGGRGLRYILTNSTWLDQLRPFFLTNSGLFL